MKPISKTMVMKMRDAYEKTIRKTSTENLRNKFPERPWIEEASSTWVSRKELEELLDANNADGLRLYYGCHYQSTNKEPILDYNGLHNLIFVATKDSVDPQSPRVTTSVDQLRNISVTGTEEVTDYDGSAGDLAQLCPPNCPPPPPED